MKLFLADAEQPKIDTSNLPKKVWKPKPGASKPKANIVRAHTSKKNGGGPPRLPKLSGGSSAKSL